MSGSSALSIAHAHLVVRAMVEADAQNRGMRIVAESNDFYRASEVELDGDRAPRTNMFEFRSLPSGNYHVTATLLDAAGHSRAYVHTQVNVVTSGLNR